MNQEIEILDESSTTLRSTTRLVEVDRPVGSHRPTKSEEDLLEIRWHGRGGQGVKTAAMLFAETAIEEGAAGLVFLRVHPRLDSVRRDPRYKAMRTRLGLD